MKFFNNNKFYAFDQKADTPTQEVRTSPTPEPQVPPVPSPPVKGHWGGVLLVVLAVFLCGIFLWGFWFLQVFGGESKASYEVPKDMVLRTLEKTGSPTAGVTWERELAQNRVSVADFVTQAFTSTSYLLQNKSDEVFSEDLAYALYGSGEKQASILSRLNGVSRIYLMEELLAELNPQFVTSRSPKEGTSIRSADVISTLEDQEGYALGLRKVEGNIALSGQGARLDIVVDRNLRRTDFVPQESESAIPFSLFFDTRVEPSGEHQAQLLLRTSDGRAKVLSGGTIIIPALNSLETDTVQPSFLPSEQKEVWYSLDAMDKNAYINFVGLKEDVKVSLYDLYGNIIGQNDLKDSPVEVLRGKKQELPTSPLPEGALPYQNIFYARVERGDDTTLSEDISYYAVQSREVGVGSSGQYFAVLNDDITGVPSPVPDRPLTDEEKEKIINVRDEVGDSLSIPMAEMTFLPINGRLAEFALKTQQGQPTNFYPEFQTIVPEYGLVSSQELGTLVFSGIGVEGYASQVTINGQATETQDNNSFSADMAMKPSRNTVDITVTDFDGNAYTYKMYVLSGADSEGYDKDTLNRFPSSYRSGLWLLHNQRPEYTFTPFESELTWQEVVDNQDNKDRSLAMYDSWVKPDSPVYDGSNWRAARREVVKYFLDPRNFLDRINIFQFENLAFDPTVHTPEGVTAIVKGSFLEGSDPDYVSILMTAGKEAGVSPYFLASRILQEMGYKGESKLAHGTLEGFEGYYNFYNIGSTPDPDIPDGALINGAKFARYGNGSKTQTVSEEAKAIHIPWTSPDLAIRGGALWIANGYINRGQDTLYFQKFDIIPNEDGLFKHQYAQNISMAYSEARRYFAAYRSLNMLQAGFSFVIPVYKDMPEEASPRDFNW